MWSFFRFLFLLVAGNALPPCENQVNFLTESWSSWNLLSPGNFSLGTSCSYTLVYPNNTALCGLFYSSEQWEGPFVDTFGGVDAFGTAISLDEYRAITCLPPPWYSIFIPPPGYQNNDFALLSMESYCQSHNCTQFRLLKVDAFKHNETVPVTPGMEPFVIVANGVTAKRTTYNFTGYPLLSAVYVKATNGYYSYEKLPLDAESFFIYNELGQIIGTPASWQGGIQQFSQLIVHDMSPGSPNTEADRPGLLAVMSTTDLEDLLNPKFIQPYYHVVTAEAIHGQTSVTIVDADSHSSYCIQYFIGYFTFTEDVDIIVHEGFPKQNLTDDMIVLRLNATNLKPDFLMVLGCTKTIRLLRGSMSFLLVSMEDSGVANFVIRQKTIKGFIKTEKKALKQVRKQRAELNFPCNKSRCNFTTQFTWEDGSPPGAKLRLSNFNAEGSGNDIFHPPNPVDWESTDQYMLTVGLNGGAVEFEITESDPE